MIKRQLVRVDIEMPAVDGDDAAWKLSRVLGEHMVPEGWTYSIIAGWSVNQEEVSDGEDGGIITQDVERSSDE